MIPEEPTAIEVEVLEIDGVAPMVPQVRAADGPSPDRGTGRTAALGTLAAG